MDFDVQEVRHLIVDPGSGSLGVTAEEFFVRPPDDDACYRGSNEEPLVRAPAEPDFVR